MRFRFTHELPVSADEALRRYVDPDFLALLAAGMKDVREVTVLEQEEIDGGLRRSVRYCPELLIERVGPVRIEPGWMDWIEHSEVDFGARRIEFRNEPVVKRIRKHLKNRGVIRFQPRDPEACTRIMEGELTVRFPVLGKVAERVIHGRAKGLLDAEAAAFGAAIAGD